jgi:NAD(P)-dependent dehydrogenase (short-subunit alcohol dehydrogenase family)
VPVGLVTGGGSGIGAACVGELEARGIRVAVIDLNPAHAARLAVELDVRDRMPVRAAVERIERELGPIDHLVTAAGYHEALTIEEIGPDEWGKMLAVHVGGTINALHAVIPGMTARGRGSICTIGSELAMIGDPGGPHYAAAKAGIHAISKSVAVELAPAGIRVNCVAPGPTDTPMLSREPNYEGTLPLGRIVSPAEIAATVCFLLLEETNMVGQVVSPNAGAVL